MTDPPFQVWGYLREYAAERDDILAAVDHVFRSGRLILGESVRGFEAAFAGFCGVAHCVGVDNGTNALVLALEALGVGRGDEVITVANTAAPTIVAIESVGARARFVDIDPDTYLMDTTQLAAAITPQTRCILPVHLYGQCVDMDAVLAVARAHGLMVLEDCAQAHGARLGERVAGSLGDAAAFSFYPTKVLGAYGDGGAVVTDDATRAARLQRLRYYGMSERYFVVESGHNARLDEVQAEILRRKLGRIDGYIARRQAIAARYHERLGDTALRLPVVAPGRSHVYYLYVARHPRRDALLDALARHGVQASVSYRWPCHVMDGFAHLGYRAGDLPRTEAAAAELLSLPMYPSLTDDEQARICDAVLAALDEVDG